MNFSIKNGERDTVHEKPSDSRFQIEHELVQVQFEKDFHILFRLLTKKEYQ